MTVGTSTSVDSSSVTAREMCRRRAIRAPTRRVVSSAGRTPWVRNRCTHSQAVINGDDPRAAALVDVAPRPVTYAINKGVVVLRGNGALPNVTSITVGSSRSRRSDASPPATRDRAADVSVGAGNSMRPAGAAVTARILAG